MHRCPVRAFSEARSYDALMADPDAAFQWETEALRTGALRRREARPTRTTTESVEPGWVTIRQAESATGIPVGTLRRWARQGALPSRSQETEAGTRRLIWLDAVLERARALGRVAAAQQLEVEPAVVVEPEPVLPSSPLPPPPPPPAPRRSPVRSVEILEEDGLDTASGGAGALAEHDDVPEQAAEASAESPVGSQPEPVPDPAAEAKPTPPDPPPGTMLVPVDAWNKMLMQLGNLHEAGRELAEARERAAKAETEASFLRERLKDLRERRAPEPSAMIAESRGRRSWFRRS